MNEISRIGMDTSKQVFQVHAVDGEERVVLRRTLRRREVVKFFAKQPATVVGLEACGGSHHWGRVLGELGHEVRLVPAQRVKPYVARNKNDAADAAALCEAMSRPRMSFVPLKTAEQQAALMLVGVRDRLIRRRTQLGNTIRGHGAEFGLVAARGTDKVAALLAQIAADETVPELARELFAELGQEWHYLQAQLARTERRLLTWQRGNEVARRLGAIPGIGPVGAALLVMKAPDPRAFRCGRDFAAWIGLTPRDHSTAGKRRLGSITRAGDETLRSVLVVGATAAIRQVRAGKGQPWPWLSELLARKPAKLAAVALANKNARIAWKLMVSGESYRPAGNPANNQKAA